MKAYVNGQEAGSHLERRWAKRWRWLPLWLSKRLKLGHWYTVAMLDEKPAKGDYVSFMYETTFDD